jgi:hypothetical protein
VNDSYSKGSDAGEECLGKRVKTVPTPRWYNLSKPLQDGIGPLDDTIVDMWRIRTAATCADIQPACNFEFDIAGNAGIVLQSPVEAGENVLIRIEPVSVAVEHKPHGRFLSGSQCLYCIEGEPIAIESSDDIDGLSNYIGRPPQVGRIGCIVCRATSSGRLNGASLSPGGI